MATDRNSRVLRAIPLLIAVCLVSLPAYAQYSGGTGEPNDPYRIATAEDLMLLGDSPEDYDKHFIMMADIDMDPYLPGRKVFDKTVIAQDVNDGWGFQGTAFTGVFDGNNHSISHLTFIGENTLILGLFGEIGSEAKISNLGLEALYINGTDGYVGGLVGHNYGIITNCYCNGTIRNSGSWFVGGLVGENYGSMSGCYSMGAISGSILVGGLVGYQYNGTIACSFSTAAVTGNSNVGGLVASNGNGEITTCYSTGTVTGVKYVGGIAGCNNDYIANSYSTGMVTGDNVVGGLVGRNGVSAFYDRPVSLGTILNCYSTGVVSGNINTGGLVGRHEEGNVNASFWDTLTSGWATSAGGTGKTTAEMQTASTFLETGWDFVGETENGTEDIWKISEVSDCPRLWWEKYSGGSGTPDNPYQIATAEELMMLGDSPEDYDKHFILIADIDLDPNLPCRKVFDKAVIAPHTNDKESWFQGIPFSGVFDGNNHTISCLLITGRKFLGLFGKLSPEAEVKNLGIADVSITSSDGYICGPVAYNLGAITNCYSTGSVSSTQCVGGFVGLNEGAVTNCYSNITVSGDYQVGGLVGSNRHYGAVTQCYSTGSVSGDSMVGGLVGENSNLNAVTQCYSTVVVSGSSCVGGLIGDNVGDVNQCYSTGAVSGSLWSIGGLIGISRVDRVTACFWDIETSSQTWSDAGTGKTTGEMRMADTFLEAGWDFVDETENGVEDIWWILEGQNYPRLWWQLGQLSAFSPNPQNGIKELIQPIILIWKSVESTASHDVYLSQEAKAVTLATIESGGVYRGRLPAHETVYEPGSLEFATTYYWRIDEVNETDPGKPCKGDIWSFTTAAAAPVSHPDPADNGTSNVNSTVLSWVPGSTVLHYDVYFGEDEQAVSDATPESVDVYIGRQTSEMTSFEPGNLELNKIYYWRVDAVDPINPSNIWKGDVWKFTTISRRHIID